jgi:hypothetical protein
MEFKFFMTTIINIVTSWDVTPCSLVTNVWKERAVSVFMAEVTLVIIESQPIRSQSEINIVFTVVSTDWDTSLRRSPSLACFSGNESI